jgi:hypothetical protein
MDFTDYQKAAMRTAGKTERPLDALACAGLGVAGEAGEVADLIKKLSELREPLRPVLRRASPATIARAVLRLRARGIVTTTSTGSLT